MKTFDEICAEYRASVERRLGELLAEDDSKVAEAMRYSALGGGKRIRAIICLAACEACGGGAADALDAACALEMIHAYSLIHDDLPCMDDDALRRGKPSCHIAFGEANALLAGDALLTKAFETLGALGDNALAAQCVLTLARAAGNGGMIGGQELDLYYENKSPDAVQLNELHRKKTGALIRAAAALGAICARADTARRTALDSYAANVGLAFQIIDDVLDAVSTDEALGKPVGSDALEGKTTYYTLYGEKGALALATELTDEAIDEYLRVFDEDGPLTELAAKLLVRKC